MKLVLSAFIARKSRVLVVAAMIAPFLAIADILDDAGRIDSLVAAQLAEVGVERNPLTTDEQFARRLYLDVVGRIPTYFEISRFLDSDVESKRADLIDALLDSEGYASHFYNYWADVLRVQTQGRQSVMVSYQDWIKESLRTNKPYDSFVREIITAEGFVWDNPAVGYYVRDAGMELDNMSNTMQVFTGTRMQCAQCHDHPFDTWTQKDYYHMASYSYGTETRQRYASIGQFKEFQQILRRTSGDEAGARKNYKRVSPVERRAIRDIFQPFQQEVVTTGRKLRLPKDYQYDNASPRQTLAARTPFGDTAKVKANEDPRESFADWMTSPRNPRFSTVISNRLWKKVMGVGLYEPVDDLKDLSEASNPALMNHLQELMVANGFDMKEYLRILLNTRAYQSQSSQSEWDPDDIYLFQGPLLRRMTAEQVWDSILTLSLQDIDTRTQDDVRTGKLRAREEHLKNHVRAVESIEPRQLATLVRYMSEKGRELLEAENKYRELINRTKDQAELRRLKKEYASFKREKNRLVDTMLGKIAEKNGYVPASSMATMEPEMTEKKGKRQRKEIAFQRNFVRASSVVSPVPPEHFLSRFGQSNREIIESSNTEASIPQVLELVNGQALKLVLKSSSPFRKNMKAASSNRQIEDVIFMSFLGRKPRGNDRELIRRQIERYGKQKGTQQVVTALLNTQEFIFVQ